MAEDRSTSEHFKLIGGELCLNFANTVDWHASQEPANMLTNYEDLITWGLEAGALDEAHAASLLRWGSNHPNEARAVLLQAVALRETIYSLLVAVLTNKPVDDTDMSAFNDFLSQAVYRRRVVAGKSHFAWGWAEGSRHGDSILWPIVISAADLMTSDRLSRLGQCADDRGCGWLFLDSSKNRSRRWCEMEDCGNRAKALRHRRKGGKRGMDGQHEATADVERPASPLAHAS